MKVSERTISVLGELVTGDKQLTRYRSGPQLVKLFNEYGANDTYGVGFPSRWVYAEEKLRQLNDSPALTAVIREILAPAEFADTDFKQAAACAYLNAKLKYDGCEVVLDNSMPKIRRLGGTAVEFAHPLSGSEEEAHIFIDEQLAKCEEKLREGDFDGAVTNARSMIEAVLLEIEGEPGDAPPDYDGDLPRLYKRVQKKLKLDPARPDIDNTVKQVLSGLIGIVAGIAGMSNKMGDRHARSYKPARRHAVLVVNSAKTLANFMFDTLQSRA